MNSENTKPRESGLSSSKWMFALCFLVYSSVYIARGNFAYARSTMLAEGVIDVGTAGILSAVYFGCYAIGQIINGAAADKRPPFLLVSIGLSVIAATNAAMTLPLPSAVRILIWATNGFGQSMLWCPIFYIISNLLHPKVRFTAITVVLLCTPLGKASCAWLSGLALSFGKWQNVFLMASSVIAAIAVLWISASIGLKKNLVVSVAETKEQKEKAEKSRGLFSLLSDCGVLLMLPAMLVYGLFMNGVVELVPSILSKEYGLSSTGAALLDSFIPIVGSVGVLLGNILYLKVFKRNDMMSALFAMTASLLPLIIMLALTLGRGEGYLFGRYIDSALFVFTYGLVYILQLSFGHYSVSLVPMRFSGFAFAATVSGIANAMGYGGSAIASYAMNYAVEKLPLWQTILVWISALVVAALFLTAALAKWNRFVKKNNL